MIARREKGPQGHHSHQPWFRRRHLTAGAEPRPHVQPACPHCKSARTYVYSSRDRPVRYHKCRKCGQTFKSVEKVVPGIPLEA